MIYLILSAAFRKDNMNEFEKILKIGYTKDDGKKSRFDCYITENPTIEILYLIPNGDEQDEKNLHYYFRDYLKYGYEWFSYEDSIIEFFKNHTTKESLKELDIYISKQKQQKLRREHIKINILKYVNRVIFYRRFNRELLTNLTEIVENNSQDFIDNYFTTNYPEIDFNKPREYDEEVANIIENIDNLSTFWEKMRYIYNLNMSEDLAKRLFSTISDISFAKYYYSISKEFASKCRYSKKVMDKEFNRLNSISTTINIDNLPNEIYNNFKEGYKYVRSSIKSILQQLYDNLGYSKKAKASDLEEYFDVKECTIPNKETGKYDRGYELLKRK